AAVDPLVDGTNAVHVSRLAHHLLVDTEERRDPAVAEALALQRAQRRRLERVEPFRGDFLLRLDEILDLREEPRIDLRKLLNLVERHAETEAVGDVADAVRARHAELALQHGPLLVRLDRRKYRGQPVDARLEAAQGDRKSTRLNSSH